MLQLLKPFANTTIPLFDYSLRTSVTLSSSPSTGKRPTSWQKRPPTGESPTTWQRSPTASSGWARCICFQPLRRCSLPLGHYLCGDDRRLKPLRQCYTIPAKSSNRQKTNNRLPSHPGVGKAQVRVLIPLSHIPWQRCSYNTSKPSSGLKRGERPTLSKRHVGTQFFLFLSLMRLLFKFCDIFNIF